jgi:two-component system, NarL family, sensor histidine kinase LiaS
VRWSGLRVRMAVSYVLVTAAAVIVVDGVVLGVLLPQLLASSSHAGRAASVAGQSGSDAKRLTAATVGLTVHGLASTAPTQLIQMVAAGPVAAALSLSDRSGPSAGPDKKCLTARSAEALIRPDGTVLASSNPAACPAGTRLSFAARPGLGGHGSASTAAGQIVWAVSPVTNVAKILPTSSPGPSAGTTGRASLPPKAPPGPGEVIGGVYVEAPAGSAGVPFAQVYPLLATGGIVLALVIPVGTVFGLLSTRRPIRRIERLADVTTTVADGDFRPRVPVSGGDEIGRLEDAFNRMAGRLSDAVDDERLRAGADARQAERARIARELHDSISQDLFSLSLLAAGLRKALRGSPALRPEVAAMERTAARAMREMQALLLELRPVALEDVGLVPAIAELCQAYQARLGIQVTAELGEVALDPVAEHAVLRVVQEALGNAARHGQPTAIGVRLGQRDGAVTLEVRDDGRGFDPQAIGERHGMGLALMRERVTELGGDFRLDAAPGQGAAFFVRLPASQDGQP